MPTSEGGYKQFKIGDLFDIHPTKAYKQTNKGLFVDGGKNPVVANSSANNGIGGYSNLPITEKGNIITFSDTTTSDAIFYQPNPFIGYPHVQGLYPKKYIGKWNEKTLLYIMSIFRKCAQGRFDYATKFTRVIALEMPLLLPIDESGEIDFDFIESRVRELEEERVCELEAYLTASNFSDCSLTLAEKNALWDSSHQTIPVKIKNLFEQYRGKEKAPNQVKEGNVPMINETSTNNGFTKLATPSKIFTGNAISISINYATTVFYQPKDFCASVNISILKNDDILTENVALFFTTLLQKNNRRYDYNHKISKDKINETMLLVPAKPDGTIDFEFIEHFVNAIKKQTIAHVKEFIEREHKAYLKATQQVCENQAEQNELKITLFHPDYQPGRIPLYTLQAACGYFEDGQEPEEEGWIDASDLGFTPDSKRHFAVHAKGDSMQPKIKDGDICIFEWYNAGSREGEIVLSQSREYDSEYGGKYTIKRYHSEKAVTEEGWQHSKVELQPLNPDFDTIELDEFGDYKTIGIFKCIL